MRCTKSHNAGFSLIELVVTMLVMAILFAIVMNSVGTDQSNLRAEINNLKAALRYTQQLSIASDNTVTYGITVTGTGYTLVRTGGSGNVPLLPGENTSTHAFSGGVSSSGGAFNFTEWGGLATGSSTSTTLTKSGSGSKTINLISETGYAYES
ncbi:MAG: prepilin-type N-terminal cleavage/methylation domain-containing protein [Syntrophaceae bacterium]|nr:prepilin-type N-terminal cleavage/methylation domain-containing protein [Syntrophaceae bacterium]